MNRLLYGLFAFVWIGASTATAQSGGGPGWLDDHERPRRKHLDWLDQVAQHERDLVAPRLEVRQPLRDVVVQGEFPPWSECSR